MTKKPLNIKIHFNLLFMAKKGSYVIKLSREIEKWLKPYSKKIKIVGSIRRKEKNPKDIDIVIIPKNKEDILNFLKTRGKFIQGGEKKLTFQIRGVKTEIYYTNEKSWGATLLAYSSRKGAAIGLRILARFKGYKLNQYGLFKNEKYISGKKERDIYNSLNKKYRLPKYR